MHVGFATESDTKSLKRKNLSYEILTETDLFVKVVFEGVRGKGYQGDIALDDIVIKDGFCPPLKECEFEDVNLCGWTNEKRYFTPLDLYMMHKWSIFGKLKALEMK